jgi:hypothetical protein
MHQGFTTFLGTKWPLEVACKLEARYWPRHVAELNLVSGLDSLFLAHPLLKQGICHNRRVVHRAPTYEEN